jgi:hypothetical protein
MPPQPVIIVDPIHRTRVRGFFIKSIGAVAGTIFTIACPKGKATWMLLSLLCGHLLGEWWTLKGDRQEQRHRQHNNQQLVALDLRVSELETLLKELKNDKKTR